MQELMKDRPAVKLKTLLLIHNAFLSLGSLVLLTLMMGEAMEVWYNVGMYNAICAKAAWTNVKI